MIIHLDGAGFYSYSSFALNIHVVKKLLLHLARRNALRLFEEPVRKGTLAVVYMRYY